RAQYVRALRSADAIRRTPRVRRHPVLARRGRKIRLVEINLRIHHARNIQRADLRMYVDVMIRPSSFAPPRSSRTCRFGTGTMYSTNSIQKMDKYANPLVRYGTPFK